jgi:hypothetical protein
MFARDSRIFWKKFDPSARRLTYTCSGPAESTPSRQGRGRVAMKPQYKALSVRAAPAGRHPPLPLPTRILKIFQKKGRGISARLGIILIGGCGYASPPCGREHSCKFV